MSELPSKSTFEVLDNGTLFTALNFWEETEVHAGIEHKFLRYSYGTWAWENVKSVLEMMTPNTFEIKGPMCTLNWNDGFIHILADYREVQLAYRRYRLRYGGPALTFTTAN